MTEKKFKDTLRKNALYEIRFLLNEAEMKFPANKNLANKYVAKARRLAMKINLRIPSDLKKRFCKHCNSYLAPGVNLRIRSRNNMMVYYCLECKRFMKFSLKSENPE